MKFPLIDNVRVVLPRAALTVVFDECDRFPDAETGGRVIGTFDQKDEVTTLQVSGIIEPGPNARRSPVMFFQDGKHQEQVFRRIESNHPQIEHLGNWHTHHMNGLNHLSDGDVATYLRTVNHDKQHTPFFYALLVVEQTRSREPQERYKIKHYLVRRGDQHVHEIPAHHVEFTDAELVWPSSKNKEESVSGKRAASEHAVQPQRAYDDAMLKEICPGIRSYTSPKAGIYWRGLLELVDGTKIEIVLAEDSTASKVNYTPLLRNAPSLLQAEADALGKQPFPSATAAIIAAERSCNRILWDPLRDSRQPKSE